MMTLMPEASDERRISKTIWCMWVLPKSRPNSADNQRTRDENATWIIRSNWSISDKSRLDFFLLLRTVPICASSLKHNICWDISLESVSIVLVCGMCSEAYAWEAKKKESIFLFWFWLSGRKINHRRKYGSCELYIIFSYIGIGSFVRLWE